jgi:hypothetical protein
MFFRSALHPTPQELRLAKHIRSGGRPGFASSVAQDMGIAPSLLVTVDSLLVFHGHEAVANMLESGQLGHWPGRWQFRRRRSIAA